MLDIEPMFLSFILKIDLGGRLHTISIHELGKQLLKAAGEGNIEEIRTLMTKGAPFTADWVNQNINFLVSSLQKYIYFIKEYRTFTLILFILILPKLIVVETKQKYCHDIMLKMYN